MPLANLAQEKKIESLVVGWFLADQGRYTPEFRWFEINESRRSSQDKESWCKTLARNIWRGLLRRGVCPDDKSIDDYDVPGDEVPIIYPTIPRSEVADTLENDKAVPANLFQFRACYLLGKLITRETGINFDKFKAQSGAFFNECFMIVTLTGFVANRPKRKQLKQLVAKGLALPPSSWCDEGSQSGRRSSDDSDDEGPSKKRKGPNIKYTARAAPPPPKKVREAEPEVIESYAVISHPESPLSDLILGWLTEPKVKMTKEDRRELAKAQSADWFHVFDELQNLHNVFGDREATISDLNYFLGRCHVEAPELELKVVIELGNYANAPRWESPTGKHMYVKSSEVFERVFRVAKPEWQDKQGNWQSIPFDTRVVGSVDSSSRLFACVPRFFALHPSLVDKLPNMLAPVSAYMQEMLDLTDDKDVVSAYGEFDAKDEGNHVYLCLTCLNDFEYSPFLPRTQSVPPDPEGCQHKQVMLFLKDYLKDVKIALERGAKLISLWASGRVSTKVEDWVYSEDCKLMAQHMTSAAQGGWYKGGIDYPSLIECTELYTVTCPFCTHESSSNYARHAMRCVDARRLIKAKTKQVADMYARLVGATEPVVRLFYVEKPNTVNAYGLDKVEEDHDNVLVDALSFVVEGGEIVDAVDMFADKPRYEDDEGMMELEAALDDKTMTLPDVIAPLPDKPAE